MNLLPWADRTAGVLVGLAAGWLLWHAAPVREGAAPEVRLPAGGLMPRRDPAAPVPAPVKRAAREAGGKLERAFSVTVQPRPQSGISGYESGVASPTSQPEKNNIACSCGPVTVDMGLLRMPDRTRRVVATSPDGEVIGGVDIPLDPAAAARSLKWAAGGSYDPVHREFGAFVDRDLGPLRLGVELQQRGDGVAAVLRAGVRF